MYRILPPGQLSFENFYLPFGGQLSSDNRWVKLSKLIPWETVGANYTEQFSATMGAPAKSFRVALGAKLSVSYINGCMFLDQLSWDNFNESTHLQDQVEAYRTRFGCYRESVHADQIYRTRAHRSWCKAHGIRLSGPPLGRPLKDPAVQDEL
jgi:Transposase DDE domain